MQPFSRIGIVTLTLGGLVYDQEEDDPAMAVGTWLRRFGCRLRIRNLPGLVPASVP